ncbi:MAG TPA: peptidylprolyl isomerase [Lacipirellulaceae bacterium]|jgi:peptidyl-prolyl cis-trans isomerase A (cyclophilin A)|nr:peptidylprolyl isomerase [Lacipirellulaceae bacterium]
MQQRRFQRLTFFALVLAAIVLVAGRAEATIIRFVTTLGNIDFRLYDTATPLHVANILSYINSDRYDGTFIHRSAKSGTQDFVIQGGGYKILSSLLASPPESGWTRTQTFGTVTNEPGISNLRGTLALAKGSGISSGSSEWFINLNDANSFLDQPPPTSNSFTVFGRVIGNGMTVVDNIAHLGRVNASFTSGGTTYNSAFSEVPVLDVNKVVAQQDVFNADVVRLTDAVVLNYKAGDYDFNGTVNAADYAVWRSSFGSTTNAAADGNGNGVVDAADYVVWRNTLGQSGGPGVGTGGFIGGNVPEPTSAVLVLIGSVLLAAQIGRQRRSGSGFSA